MTAPNRIAGAHDAVSERAAEYFERRHCAEWSAADQAELDAWLAESFLHRAAYLRVTSAFAHAENLVARHPGEFDRTVAGSAPNFLRYRYFVPLLAAASIAVMAAIAAPYLMSLLQPPVRTFSTDVGDHTLLKFADGTEIELNTDSAIRYRMTTAERTVWLERGEAWFRVAHNSANPFTVIAGTHRVSDLGTEFLVRRGSDRTEVTLLKGRAALSMEGAQTAMLKPGDDAIATSVSISVTRKTPRQLSDELAWRGGMLVFRKTKLAEVVREFNRYNTTKLVIADPSIADETISADIKTDAFEDFLNLAEATLNLRADREGDEILISRKPGEETRRAAHNKRSE